MRSRHQKENQYRAQVIVDLFRVIVIVFQDHLEGVEVDTENEDMTMVDQDNIAHIILNMDVIPIINKLRMGTILEAIVLVEEVLQGVVSDHMRNISVTQDMPTSILMVGALHRSSIFQEATRIEVTTQSTQGANQVTAITTDV